MTDITTNRVSTDRLNQIARAIADGNYRELTMRIPAEPDRDADLVISAAADEIDRLRAEVTGLRDRLRGIAQILIAEVGANGPNNAEDAARKAVAEIARLREALTECIPALEIGLESARVISIFGDERPNAIRDALKQARAALAPQRR